MVSKLGCYNIFKYPNFNQKKKLKVSPIYIQTTETASKWAQMVDFADKDLKAVTTDMPKELYELVSNELKESIVTVS